VTEIKRVAVIADSHFDSTPGGRFAECIEVHDWILQDLEARDNVDLILHAGDVFERRSTAEERLAVFSWFQRAANIAPVVVVRGNHDQPRELQALTRLQSLFDIIVEERAGTYAVGGCAVAALAWPSKASVLAMGATSHQVGEIVAGDALRAVLRGLGQEMEAVAASTDYDMPRILLMHAMVRGSMTSTGQPLVGCDLEVGLDDLALAHADFIALGHVHKHQDWQASTVYPGSPRRTAFGEVEPKGYVIANFRGAEYLSFDRIETPCAPMLMVDGTWDESEQAIDWRDDVAGERGADVRLRYAVPADRREQAAAAARGAREMLLARGARSVKTEERVIAASAARAPEVARAATTADKLRALWAAQDRTPEAARADGMLCKLCTIEEAAQ